MAFLDKMKKNTESFSEKTKNRLAMEGLLKQARISLEDYFSPKIVKPEERFSRDLFRDAQGIVLISEGKGGLVFAGKAGTGIALCRLDKKDEWSAPLAIKTGGISWGFQGGIAKCDHIILLPTSAHVHAFMAKGSIQIQGNAQAAVGKIGRDAGVGLSASEKSIVPVLSYSFKSEGLYGGISLEGAIIASRNGCNDDYYNCKNVSIGDIIKGKIRVSKPNNDYNKIVSLLNEYCNPSQPIQSLQKDTPLYQSDVKNEIPNNINQKLYPDVKNEIPNNINQKLYQSDIKNEIPNNTNQKLYQSDIINEIPNNINHKEPETKIQTEREQIQLNQNAGINNNINNNKINTTEIVPPLDTDPFLDNRQPPLDERREPLTSLQQQQPPIPFYHAPKNQRTHPPPP